MRLCWQPMCALLVVALASGSRGEEPVNAPALVAPLNAIQRSDCACGDKPAPTTTTAKRDKPVLRISADPNNLPFTNNKQEGFENKIADIIARELGMEIEYAWRA